MQNYKFVQTVKIKDKVFNLGIHPVPEYIEEHPDFLHYVRCGWIFEAPNSEPKKEKPAISEQQKQLAARIEKKLEANKEKIKKESDDNAKNPHVAAARAASSEVPKQEWSPETEPIEAEDDGGELPEETLTPTQKAARTRKANAAAKAAKES